MQKPNALVVSIYARSCKLRFQLSYAAENCWCLLHKHKEFWTGQEEERFSSLEKEILVEQERESEPEWTTEATTEHCGKIPP